MVVNKPEGKYATAHDLRRAFGTRWAARVKPATLQLLMRHRNIETTLKFYVEQDADDVAETLWADHGNTFGNSRPETGSAASDSAADAESQVVDSAKV